MTDDEIQQSQAVILSLVSSQVGAELLRSIVGKGMESPNQDGLFELIAPDGTLAKVVDGRISSEELQSLIRVDVSRQLQPTLRRMMEEGRSDEEISQTTSPMYLQLKKGYRLARLPSPK